MASINFSHTTPGSLGQLNHTEGGERSDEQMATYPSSFLFDSVVRSRNRFIKREVFDLVRGDTQQRPPDNVFRVLSRNTFVRERIRLFTEHQQSIDCGYGPIFRNIEESDDDDVSEAMECIIGSPVIEVDGDGEMYVLEFYHHFLSLAQNRISFYHHSYSKFRGDRPEESEGDLVRNYFGESRVFRASQGGWVYIQGLHMKHMSYLDCHTYCGCIKCVELRDRIVNASNGIYDFIDSQIGFRIDINMIPNAMWGLELYLYVYDDVSDYGSDDGEDQDGLPVAIRFGNEQDCVVCMCGVAEDEFQAFISCGHAMHLSCLQQWLGHHMNCPLCRAPVNIGRAESRFISENFTVEYVSTDVMGDLEYCDPIDYYDLEHGDRKYHCYVLTTGRYGLHYRLKGEIQAIWDLTTDTKLSGPCKDFDYLIQGEFEIQIVATSRVEIELGRLEEVALPVKKIGLYGLGTFGDIEPLRQVMEVYRDQGYEVYSVFPKGFGAKYEYEWSIVESALRSACTVVPSWKMLMAFPAINAVNELFKRSLDEEKPEFVVATPFTLLLTRYCAQRNIPVVAQRSIPKNQGALVYMEQDTPLKKTIARCLEKFQLAQQDSLSFTEAWEEPGQYPSYDLDIPFVESIAPVLSESGTGTFVQGPLTDQKYEADIFFGLGSMVDLETEKQYLDWLRLTGKKILFQTRFDLLPTTNVQFIKSANHGDVFSQVPLVICHGGSGTLQTALRYGCRVLVVPKWVDQKFWPSRCQEVGLPVEFAEKEKIAFIRQCKKMYVRKGYLPGVTGYDLTQLISMRYVRPERELGTFVYMSPIRPAIFSSLESTVLGSSRAEHVGVGHLHADGSVQYMELAFDFSKVTMVQSKSQGICQSIHHVKFVDMPYAPTVFRSFIRRRYTLASNCRSAVAEYCLQFMGDNVLDKWVEECKWKPGRKFTGKKERVREETYDYSFSDDDRPKWAREKHELGDIEHPLEMFRRVEKVDEGAFLDVVNEMAERLCYPPCTSIPAVDSMHADLILPALAIVTKMRVAVWANGTGYVINEGAPGSTIYVKIDETGYRCVRFPVMDTVGATTMPYEVTHPPPGVVITATEHDLAHAAALLRKVENQLKLKVKDRERVRGLNDWVSRYGDVIIKLSFSRFGAPYKLEGEMGRIKCYSMPYLPDDGLPAPRMIYHYGRWQDVHRGNIRSIYGCAILIDQPLEHNHSDLYKHKLLEENYEVWW